MIKAAIALNAGALRRALDLLEAVRPYDAARPPPGMALMYPPFLRGEAFLALGDAHAAAIEFQKVIDQPGLTLNFSLGVVARLELSKIGPPTPVVAQSPGAPLID